MPRRLPDPLCVWARPEVGGRAPARVCASRGAEVHGAARAGARAPARSLAGLLALLGTACGAPDCPAGTVAEGDRCLGADAGVRMDGSTVDGGPEDAGRDAGRRDGGPDTGVPEDAGPCGECAPGTPVCVGTECEECTVADDALCVDDTPVCDPGTNSCVACLVNGDCTRLAAPQCGVEHECVDCTGNEACAGRTGTLACDEVSGGCVECTETNTAACGGNACRPDGTCSDYPAGRFACEACDTDANCAAGHLCVEMSYAEPSPGVIGTFCLWTRDAGLPGPNGSCGTLQSRPFATEVPGAVSVDGMAAPVCTLRTTTCPALLQHTMPDADCTVPFTDDDACGVPGFTDGRCRLNSATQPRCTYPCGGNEDCFSGFTCPAAGDRYCSI